MKKMSGNEIRKMWLEFFKSKGHDVEEGASLIPSDDKSLLWMNAGVTPLKKYFDGRKVPKNPRICNAQKCIRTNDIENVGKTSRHHTFFEMLGNFSIGDYFREEVIPWAFELLTSEEWFGFDKNKLYITHYPTDLDTKNLWIKCGMEESHMVPCEGNFWEIGSGPCGPDTEIFFDRGPEYGDFTKEVIENDIENDRYIEIWNIVFSQYNSDGTGKRESYKLLPKKNIDTGSGLERLACVMQGSKTNFETDLFLPIINEIEKLTNIKYDGQESFKIIADHIRTITFAVGDGALFSNEGRGYVLRRLLRRAVKHGFALGLKEPFLYNLVDIVTANMGEFYNRLYDTKELTKKLIKIEEIKFYNTIDSGLEKLKSIMDKSNGFISGEDAFILFDTYGFPLELTIEYAMEKGIKVDSAGFKESMEKQKERARSHQNNINAFAKQNEEYMNFKDELVFTGYDSYKETSKIVKVFDKGFVTEKTPFYAVCGGQVGDSGVVIKNNQKYPIIDTIMMPNKQHLHVVENPLLFNEGDIVTLEVDTDRREIIRSNHSACHLLFKALREVLGSHVSQQGSLINENETRFDFNHYEPLTDAQILKIEELTNSYIKKSYKGETNEMTLDEAKNLGAIAEFGEKYASKVRVVNLGATIDVCGGTHVSNTSEIGKIMILSVSSIGSGIYRIISLSEKCMDYEKEYLSNFSVEFEKLYNKANSIIENAKKYNVQVKFEYRANTKFNETYQDVIDIRLELAKLQNEVKKFEKETNNLISKASSSSYKDYETMVSDKGGVILLDNFDKSKLRELIDYLSNNKSNTLIAIINVSNDRFDLLVKSTNSNKDAASILKSALSLVNGRGGGKKDFAQGGGQDISRIKEIQELLLGEISK